MRLLTTLTFKECTLGYFAESRVNITTGIPKTENAMKKEINPKETKRESVRLYSSQNQVSTDFLNLDLKFAEMSSDLRCTDLLGCNSRHQKET